MHLTRQSEYAVKMLLELSVNSDNSISAKIISERQGIPEFFLKKTIQVLAKAGIVSTQRGSQGGVKLLIPPEKITIADVIRAIEGEFAINLCLASGNNCPDKKTCNIHKILRRTQDAMISELKKETFAELAGHIKKQKREEK